MAIDISDQDWFQAIAHPGRSERKFPFALPSIPPKSVQRGYNAKLGIDSLKHDLKTIRTGRANPSILDNIVVPYYGTPTPLAQVANVSTPDARSLSVKPFDKAITEDDQKRADADIQTLTDKFVKEVDDVVKEKEKELMAL